MTSVFVVTTIAYQICELKDRCSISFWRQYRFKQIFP